MPEEAAQPSPASTTQPHRLRIKMGSTFRVTNPDVYLLSVQMRTTQRNYERLVADPYHGAIVIDAKSGKILFEERAGAYGYPASVTKLMTLLLTLEAIDRGEIQLSDRVLINNEVAGIGGLNSISTRRRKTLLWKICSMASWCTRPTTRARAGYSCGR